MHLKRRKLCHFSAQNPVCNGFLAHSEQNAVKSMAHKGQHYLVPCYFSDVISYNLPWLHTHRFPCCSFNVYSISCLRVFAFTFLRLEYSSPAFFLSIQMLPFQRGILWRYLLPNSIAHLSPHSIFISLSHFTVFIDC